MSKTKIEWAEETVNPFAGCSKVSPGCDNCYALRMAWRLANNPNPGISSKYKETVEKVGGKLRWTGVAKWSISSSMEYLYNSRKGKKVFVGSMGDIAFENFPYDSFAAVLNECHSINKHRINYKKEPHIFLFLTKRPARLKALWEMYFFDVTGCNDGSLLATYDAVYSTFWLGVTAENQEQADARISALLSIPAAKHFVSIEPMLGPVDLLKCYDKRTHVTHSMACTAARLDLVICGGESGPGARPVYLDWMRGVRDQCKEAGVPFFFKQWGEWAPGRFDKRKGKMICNSSVAGGDIGRIYWTNPGCPKTYLWDQINKYWTNASAKIGKKDAGRILDGKEYLEWPE